MSITSLPARAAAAGAAVIVLVVVAVLVLDPTFGDDGAAAPGAGTTATTGAPTEEPGVTLADLDTTGLTVQRAAFCDLVASEDVEAALGGAALGTRSYDNGDATMLTADVTDIAAEYGCRWKRDRVAVRAWVFAPPVTTEQATRLAAAARTTEGCKAARRAPAYGEPTLARTCSAGKGYEASYRGLFGDAWLACSLTTLGTRKSALEQVEDWCVTVAEAASQPVG